jgi:hypothetical protein
MKKQLRMNDVSHFAANGMIALFWILTGVAAFAEITFTRISALPSVRIQYVALSRIDPSIIAAGSDNGFFLSRDGGSSFSNIAVLKNEPIRDLFIDARDGLILYYAGSRNAYRSREQVEKIFTAREGEEIHALVRHMDALYVGTSAGLYVADKTLLAWQPVPGLRNMTIHSLEGHGSDLYICSSTGVYRYRPDETLTRLFISRNRDGDTGLIPYQLKVDAMTPSRLWLCTSRGIYVSNDRGATWQKQFVNGAGNMEAYCLVQFPLDGNHFYFCGSSGVFKVEIESGVSQPLYRGLPTSNIPWMDVSVSGVLYLATDQGLYRQGEDAPAPSLNRKGLAEILLDEPSIQEVQEAAMRYNSVHPDKTADWRRRLKYRALFPKLDVDYDKTIGSSFTSSGYYYARGPYDWGVSLTWDMGNLIWNSYEDDIDNRTKLTTQLRLDILDEVNRLYFERLRLKHEIARAIPGIENTTLQELRLHEITATLNGYTGGLYSR